MPRLKKKDELSPAAEAVQTLTAGRSRRTIKPNRKYLNDSVVLATASKNSSRSSSPDSENSEDEYRQGDDDDEEILSKSAAGRKPVVVPKKTASTVTSPSSSAPTGTGRPRGRPPKHGVTKSATKTEPIKNLRKEVLKKMDLTTLNMGKARVVLTPMNKLDIKRKLDLDQSLEKGKQPIRGKELQKEKPAIKAIDEKEKPPVKAIEEKERPKLDVRGIRKKPVESPVQPIRKKPAESPVQPIRKKPVEIPVQQVRKKPVESPIQQQKAAVVQSKVINPVALKKRQVEKTILDNRGRRQEPINSSEDSDDDVQIVGISRETAPFLGRKSMRKSPLITKQVSPLGSKTVVARPPIPNKATPLSLASATQKRKLNETDEEKRQVDKFVKVDPKGRPSKAAKLSITLDSDDDEDTEDDEPIRRSTRSSFPSDKSSAASTPQNTTAASAKANDSPASAGGKITKSIETPKTNLSRTVSMPALDKSKTVVAKPAQVPIAKTAALSKPVAQSTPKPTFGGTLAEKKSKSELNLVDPIRSVSKGQKEADKSKIKNATIRIVDIGDIMKKKSASTPNIHKVGVAGQKFQEDNSDDSEDSVNSDEDDSSDMPKTNDQLVATILERKRPINLDHLRTNRPVKRGRPPIVGKQMQVNKTTPKPARQSYVNLTDDDEIDFEDMLQTNIVTANTVQKGATPKVITDRRRQSQPGGSDENSVRSSATGTVPSNKNVNASNNNNNLYKTNNNGRFGSQSSLNRSGSASPQKNPPRILNSTMKLGDSRPFAKLVTNSGNKHYSIDLTDPDNNVKLIASHESPPQSPLKRSPTKTVPRPIVASTGLRNASNALNKPVGGAVQRSISSLTSSAGSSPKMKKITCYETWYVINIPNNENKPEKPSFAMSMIGLGNVAAQVSLPSDEWSHKIILTKRKVIPLEGDEVFNGDVEDRAISEDEKRNYEPCNIMFRRKTATPGKFNLQYDRAVIFKNDTFFINVDGKNCQLVGAPSKLDGTEDIETLLSLVDYVNLKNTCVELSTA
ncbi:nucleolar protein dao-5 [Topomyia yanbarensis]|uniref:nucleolar protein dao-5 n=1 Tax=Topomyia yanbarensis TaxID=2498891 RepID=UPI00273AE76D|nr:nucleolar protein dao-5 [Topomyia yanbarensis]XP_058822959.1 nucleolar protein dao-5 [Topomyia yanbarensis]